MITCPNCNNDELVGALFCSECGNQLAFTDGVPTTTFKSSSIQLADTHQEILEQSAVPPTPVMPGKAGTSLNIMSSGDILSLKDPSEVTLGRVNEGQPIIPDIDLAPYKAFESGVSRMHATIQLKDKQMMVIDLESANGTRINGQKISPKIPYPVKHGDILTLGRLKIQVLQSKE